MKAAAFAIASAVLAAALAVGANRLRADGQGEAGTFTGRRLTPIDIDVVIIGAGVSGLRAAKILEEEDPSLTYVVLEGANYVGGRLRQTPVTGFLPYFSALEDGAVEIRGADNPFKNMVQHHPNMDFETMDFMDATIFDEGGNKLSLAEHDAWLQDFESQEMCLSQAGRDLWNDHNRGRTPTDIGARAQVESHCALGPLSTPLEKLRYWYETPFEFCQGDTSLFSYGYVSDTDYVFWEETGSGVQVLAEDMMASLENGGLNTVHLNTEVTSVTNWNTPGTQRVIVEAEDSSSGAPVLATYQANAVISTVSLAVLQNFPFISSLDFSRNVMDLTHYVKIFYRFQDTFWRADNTEWILVAEEPGQENTACKAFTNMNFYRDNMPFTEVPILICYIVTDTYLHYLSRSSSGAGVIDDTLLRNDLLVPLRRAYDDPSLNTAVQAVYQVNSLDNRWWGNADYANWRVGGTYEDYDAFFEQGFPKLYLGGSASCPEHADLLEGAYYAGEAQVEAMLYNRFGRNNYKNWKNPPCY